MFNNLAGVKNCDEPIKDELNRAGISFYIDPSNKGEVKSSIVGVINTKNGQLTLTRAWRYWVVEGLIDKETAEKIYTHPEGKKTVRASGHAGCVDPKGFYQYFDEDKKELLPNSSLKDLSPEILRIVKSSNSVKFVDNPKDEGKPFIKSYHIDGQAGLLLFSLMVTSPDTFKDVG